MRQTFSPVASPAAIRFLHSVSSFVNSPAYSWPRTTGGLERDVPSTMWTSVPQTPQASTLTKTSSSRREGRALVVTVRRCAFSKRATFIRSSKQNLEFLVPVGANEINFKHKESIRLTFHPDSQERNAVKNDLLCFMRSNDGCRHLVSRER